MNIAPAPLPPWQPRGLTPLAPRPTGVIPRLPPLDGVRAVALDVYGTMLCSGAGELGVAIAAPRADAACDALAAAGLAPHPQAGAWAVRRLTRAIHASHRRSRRGGTAHPEVDIRELWSHVLDHLARRQWIAAPVPPDRAEWVAGDYECRLNPVWPMPGLGAALAAMRAQGCVLTIVSNAQFYTPRLLAAFPETGWSGGLFDPHCSAWSWERGVAKPSPDVLQYTLNGLASRHGIESREVLCVGNDMLNDLLPAATLGCRTALFAGDARSLRLRADDSRCASLRPDTIITHWSQLPPLLRMRETAIIQA